MSPKLVPTLADRGCRVVSATDPHGRNLGFLDPEPLLFQSSSSSNPTVGKTYFGFFNNCTYQSPHAPPDD
jgi:hypothetical protein